MQTHTVSDTDFLDPDPAPVDAPAAPVHRATKVIADEDFEDKDENDAERGTDAQRDSEADRQAAKAGDQVDADDDDAQDTDADKASEAAKALNQRKSGLEKRKLSIQAQIDDLVKQRGETQRERDAIRAELDTLRAERDTLKAQTAKPDSKTPPEGQASAKERGAADADPEPKEEDFESYRDFVKAQARWEAREAIREEHRKAAEERQRVLATRAQETRRATYQQRLAAARDKHADFDARISVDLPLTLPMQDVIIDSDIPAEIMLYLADHPDEAHKIRGMASQIAQYGEMKKIEARIEARLADAQSGPSAAIPLSSAKPLIKPVKDSHGAATADDEDPEDVDAYVEKHTPKNRYRNR
jgi:hypothetical protein